MPPNLQWAARQGDRFRALIIQILIDVTQKRAAAETRQYRGNDWYAERFGKAKDRYRNQSRARAVVRVREFG